VCDKAVLVLFVFIVGWVTVLVGLRKLTRQDAYLTHITIHTDRLLHKTDEHFLSVALDVSRIQNGWVHQNIK
jgi:hypothetical protein